MNQEMFTISEGSSPTGRHHAKNTKRPLVSVDIRKVVGRTAVPGQLSCHRLRIHQ
ncbi:MAG: hypothetical protein KKI15_11395 [Proteobacteria bacterium]|nr:hypothetical protein [Pseudomonadota bacterium]